MFRIRPLCSAVARTHLRNTTSRLSSGITEKKPDGLDHTKPEKKKGISERLAEFVIEQAQILSQEQPAKKNAELEQAMGHLAARFRGVGIDVPKNLSRDMEAAYWWILIGASVRFVGDLELITTIPLLKTKFREKKDSVLEEVNAGPNCNFTHRDFNRLEFLRDIRTLRFMGCPYFDDTCLDRLRDLTFLFETLEHLELLGLKLVTDKGLSTIANYHQLKTLKLVGLPSVDPKANVVMFLDTHLVNCDISFDEDLLPKKVK